MSGGNLTISGLDRDQDTGIYQCTASNKWGSLLSHRASLQFAYLENFKTQTVRSAVNVREGQGVVLLCGPPTHSGELSFAWIFNEYPYFVQQDTRRFISQETGSLYVAKVESSDVGNYTCVVNNTITREKVLSLPTPLVLRNDGVMGEYEPKIEVHFPDSIPAAKGSTVKLECFALGNPVPEISWRRTSGVPFPGKVKMRNSNAVLEIPNFQQEDTGTYECVAENSRGKNTARGRLSFHAKPHWLQTITDTALSIEENLFWECKASGKPKPSYSWLRNGETLTSEMRVQMENGALTVSALNLSDAGLYQCVAENKHGVIYSSAELMVLASPPSFSRSALQAVLKALSGSQVSLDCQPQASPPASSLWKKGNELLQKSDRITLLPNGTLRIANVTKRDSAGYTCIARNQFGSASTTGMLLVTEPTRITLRPTNMEIIVGESIVLPCQMACDPALDVSFSWAFNGQLIDFQRDGEHFERVGGLVADIWGRGIRSRQSPTANLHPVPSVSPKRLRARSVSAAQIEVFWEPLPAIPERVLGYEVVYWEDDTKPDTVGKVRISGNYTLVNVTGLTGHTPYYLAVAAFNTAGSGPQSVAINITTKKPPPGQPPVNVEWSMTGSLLTLHWDPVVATETESPVTGYMVLLKRQGYSDIDMVRTDKNNLELNLPASDNYLVQIKALTQGGEGVGSEPIHVHKSSMGARGSGAPGLLPLYSSAVLISTLLSTSW
ncbi:unnamed protein product [Arctogadus glacialis]